jgi:uncharacterized protein YceH (UPF0502 family)
MENDDQQTTEPKWKPIPKIHRRVLGVLVEKAKTTPNGYPLSLNGVITGSNQKSNRSPKMDLTPEDAEDALEELRTWGAVGEVHGDGRVVKYRHYMKDWLGVDGTELAVMAELMLRGAQTVGELRGRAARMAGSTLPDVSALRPVLSSLMEKKLVASLSPPGRGQIVTHTLFLESEMDKVKSTHAATGAETAAAPSAPAASRSATPTPPAAAASSTNVATSSTSNTDAGLRAEVEELRQEVARLKKEVEDIWDNLSS